MASDHLTAEELAAYQSRALGPTELLKVSDHLAECDQCREQIARQAIDLGETASLSYEELVEYLDGDIDPLRRRELSEKLQRAPQSRAELQDLTKFRDEMNAITPNELAPSAAHEHRILIFPRMLARWALPLAAAIALAATGVWWATRDSGTARTITLRDGDRDVLLKANGRLRGLSGVPEELVPSIVTAMRESKLMIPEPVQKLAGDRATLAGAPNESSEFQAKSPIATAVRERMPRFHWRAQPGATQYRIRVVDWESGEVTMTGESDGPRTEWVPAAPLEAGKVYQWQAEALRNNEVIARTPKPPEPEARFRVLSDTERLKVEAIGRSVGKSHLAMAVADVDAGLLDDATEQLRMLAKENPNSQIPAKLISQIKATRSGKDER